MKFNSLPFLFLFLPLVMVAWRLWPRRRLALGFITVASYVFYAFAARWYTGLMLVSTCVDFTVGRLLDRTEAPGRRKLILVVSLIFNLGMLAFFKYFNFFVDGVNAIWAGPGNPLIRTTLDVGLPAGISFYTFQSMGYSIDVYRRDLKPCKSLLEFASFVSLFPQLIAGPIVRPSLLLPQLAEHDPSRAANQPNVVDNSRVTDGAFLFTCGLLKKVLIADRIAFFADPILNAPRTQTCADLWLGMAGFMLQIYFDFSGYTDMARGLARMLGLEFSINFDSPYHATSPSDFWKRWHVSLSSWLRDYLYIPLGGNRKGKTRTGVNLFVTMLLGGLWHGAGVSFLVWGAFHGALLLVYHRVDRQWLRIPVAVQRAIMVVVLLISWVPFRMHTMADLVAFGRGAVHLSRHSDAPWQLWAFVLLGAAVAALPVNSNRIAFGKLSWPKVALLAAGAIVAILHLNLSSKFLYFQF